MPGALRAPAWVERRRGLLLVVVSGLLDDEREGGVAAQDGAELQVVLGVGFQVRDDGRLQRAAHLRGDLVAALARDFEARRRVVDAQAAVARQQEGELTGL